MTTAEQLLASLYETDRTFIIDNDLRKINIPANINNLGVQSDDDVLTVYFQMPSAYCGINLSQFNIRINYLNGAGEGDYHDVDDAEVQSDGTIKFSWTVGRHAASAVGNVEFNVCMKKTDSSGKVIKEFNTTTATLPILKGLEVSEQVISEYNDILEQWRAKLFGIGDTEEGKILTASEEQQQAIAEKSESVLNDIELKGAETLATIPDTYTEVYRMADEALRTKADAIVLEAEGTAISVNDSADDHLLNLKMFGRTTQETTTGKNMLDVEENLNFTYIKEINTSIPAGIYTLTWEGQTHEGDYDPYIRFRDNDTGKLLSKSNNGWVVTLNTDETQVYIYSNNYSAANSTGVSATVTKLMLSVDGGDYEPYTGGVASPNPEYPQELVSVENPTVSIYGKNLLAVTAETGDTSVGCTITANGDGSVTINGTATKEGSIPLNKKVELPVGQYVLSGEKVTAFLRTSNAKHISTHFSGSTITIDDPTTHLFICVYANNGQVFDNFRTYPMLRAVSANDSAHEDYKSVQTLTLAHTLHGIPVTSGGNYVDENGQRWICDEVDFNRGVYIQRILDYNFTGNENWWLHESGRFYSVIGDMLGYKFKSQCAMCSHVAMSKSSNPGYYGLNGTNGFYFNKNDLFTTVDDLTEFLKNNTVKVAIALDEPIETPLTAEELMAYRALKTNRTNTTIVNDRNAPMAIAYSADTLTFLRDNQPKPTYEQVKTAVDEYIDENGLAKTTATIVNNILVIK